MEPHLEIDITTSLPTTAADRLGLADDDAAAVDLKHVLSEASKARIHDKLVDALKVELSERRETLGISPGEELAMGQAIGQGIGTSIQI